MRECPVTGQADAGVADEAAVDAVLTASRTLIAVATSSLGAAAEDTTIAQYRALVVLASRGPQRMTDLAGGAGRDAVHGGADVRPAAAQGPDPPAPRPGRPPRGAGLDHRRPGGRWWIRRPPGGGP